MIKICCWKNVESQGFIQEIINLPVIATKAWAYLELCMNSNEKLISEILQNMEFIIQLRRWNVYFRTHHSVSFI